MEYGLVVVWLVAFLALGLAALPIAAVLFERLPDRGAGVAPPLALTLVTLPAYWAGHLAFGWPALLVGLAVLLACSAVAQRRFDASPNWGAVGDTAAVFAVAFGFMVAIRAVDPAVHPILGEKFLDFGVLKATLRADALPPEDFWFAGEPLAYYYGGHMIAALLATLTDTAANYAYNLALAGFYAMYVTAAYGVGGAVGQARGTSRRLAGLSAAFFVALASNLATPLRALAGVLPMGLLTTAAPEKAETFSRGLAEFTYWPASRAMDNSLITEFPLFAWLNGDLHAHMMSPPFTLLVVALLFAYFRTPGEEVRRRRLLVFGCLPPVSGLLVFVNTWTALTPAGLTALTLYFAPTDPTTLLPESLGGTLRRFAGTGPGDAEGARAATDGGAADDDATGDEQADEGVADSGVADGGESVAGRGDDAAKGDDLLARSRELLRFEGVRGATAVASAATIAVVALVFVLPYLLGSASGRELAFWPAYERTELTSLLVAHGGFVLVFLAYLRGYFGRLVAGSELPVALALLAVLAVGVAQSFPAFGLFAPLVLVAGLLLRGDAAPTAGGLADDASGLWPYGLAVVGLVPVALVVVLEVAPVLAVGVVVLAPLALVARVGLAAEDTGTSRASGDDGVGYETLLMVAGAGLVTIVEFLYVVEWAAPGRFNTVFKTYAQVWALWAVGGGVMFAVLVERHVLRPLSSSVRGVNAGGDGKEGITVGDGGRQVPVFAIVAVVLLVGSLSLYGGLALSKHFTGTSMYARYQTVDDPTLNATAFVQESHAEEAAAIRWLDEREGTPTIVTAPGYYRWNPSNGKGASAPASLTGLPTVIGWAHHVRGFRGPGEIQPRVNDVDAIYTGNVSQRACLLAKYDVQYVYVGPAEAAKYGDGVERFAEVPGVGTPKVFGDGEVRIYPVDQAALPDGTDC